MLDLGLELEVRVEPCIRCQDQIGSNSNLKVGKSNLGRKSNLYSRFKLDPMLGVGDENRSQTSVVCKCRGQISRLNFESNVRSNIEIGSRIKSRILSQVLI